MLVLNPAFDSSNKSFCAVGLLELIGTGLISNPSSKICDERTLTELICRIRGVREGDDVAYRVTLQYGVWEFITRETDCLIHQNRRLDYIMGVDIGQFCNITIMLHGKWLRQIYNTRETESLIGPYRCIGYFWNKHNKFLGMSFGKHVNMYHHSVFTQASTLVHTSYNSPGLLSSLRS